MPEVLTMRGVTRDYRVGSGFARRQTLRALRGVDLSVVKHVVLEILGRKKALVLSCLPAPAASRAGLSPNQRSVAGFLRWMKGRT